MKKRNRVLALTMAAAMSASLLAGCGSSTQQGGAAASSEALASTTAAADGEEDNIIRVGVVCSMTGGSAIYGEGAQNAIDMAQFVKEYSPKSLRNREGFWYNRRKPPREAPSWKSTPKTPAAKQWLLT